MDFDGLFMGGFVHAGDRGKRRLAHARALSFNRDTDSRVGKAMTNEYFTS